MREEAGGVGQPGYLRFTSIASTLGRNPFMAFGERFIAPLLPLRKKLAKKREKITATRIKMLPGAAPKPHCLPPFPSPRPFATRVQFDPLPSRRAVVVQVEIYIRPTKSPRMRMRMRIGDGEGEGLEVEGWQGVGEGAVVEDNADGACLLSSAHKFTKISQPTDQQNKKPTLQGSYEEGKERKEEVERVELASAVAGSEHCSCQGAHSHTRTHTT